MEADNQNEETIFNAAIEIDSPQERADYVESACGDDVELRARVEDLLKIHYDDDRFLASPPGGAAITLDSSPLSEGPGTTIGRYKLLQQIGEGGFGAVYMAEQRHPIRRKVALKIIKLGMDTKQVIARFEAERQALAMMDHPNIAKVLDAGATASGRPYFVMELVKGIPVTEYCDKNDLDTHQRLELFMNICKAVQHAHHKGIIHRDIKPSNILITLRDDDSPVPKVIDFGIAKATQARLTEKTLFTEFKQFIGTPEYMSPEQARMGEMGVDTRSDIYSLGVLLYELLTGVTPFDSQTLRNAAYNEIQRIISEDQPPKPSTRLSTLGDSLGDIAKHRKMAPSQLRREIQGELDWIVLKALEKDRTRRYGSADDLALDIERHLTHQPVAAGPPSKLYRMRKFVRRHQTAVAAALLVAAALVIGLCLATVGFIQAGQQRDRAITAEVDAVAQRDTAVEAQKETQRANENLVWENYIASIGMAQRFIEQGKVHDAESLLLSCPEEHRNWEWGHLIYRCNQDLKAVKIDTESIFYAGFSPDGKWIAVGGDKSLEVWDGGMNKKIITLPGACAAFSSDSRYLAVAGGPFEIEDSRTIEILDLQTLRIVQTLTGHDGAVKSIAFSPDDKSIASCSKSGPAIIHDVKTGKQRYRLERPTIQCITFSPDGRYLATGETRYRISGENWSPWEVRLWDAETGTFLKEHGVHRHSVYRVVFTPDSRNVISVSWANKDVISWDIQTNNVEKLPNLRNAEVHALAISPDGRYLAMGYLDMTVVLYDLKKQAGVYVFKDLAYWAVAFSPDGKQLAVGCTTDSKIRFWDMSELAQGYLQLKGHTGDINSMAFGPDGKLLATGAGNWNSRPLNDDTARIWDLNTGQMVHELPGRGEGVWSVAFNPDGSLLATGNTGAVVDIWSVRTGAHIQSFKGHNGYIRPVVFHPTKKILASGAGDKTAKIWDLTTGQEIRTLGQMQAHIDGLDFSLDGQLIATASGDKTIKIWEWKTGKVLKEFAGHEVRDVAFSPGGKRIASASYDYTARIWDLASDRPLHILESNYQVLQLAFSPNGKRLFTAGRNGTVQIWDVQTGRELMELGYTLNRDPSMAMSPDGRWLALCEGHDAVILPSFPWREDEYPGDPAMSLGHRIELYKRGFWQRWLANFSTEKKPVKSEDLMGSRLTPSLAKYNRLLFKQVTADAGYSQSIKEAVKDYTKAIQNRPEDWWLWNNRGILYGNLGEWEKAIADHTRALEISPADVTMLIKRGDAYWNLEQYAMALGDYAEVRKIAPDNDSDKHSDTALFLNAFAWMLATSTTAEMRKGDKAVEFAIQACERTNWEDAACVDTLAAAYAEAGDFEAAVQWQEKAIKLLSETGRPHWQAGFEGRLKLYQTNEPYRENSQNLDDWELTLQLFREEAAQLLGIPQ